MKSYLIEYQFKLPADTKHSSYTYQKLFRAIYGYTQNVTKANGKTYRYHRKGVLSGAPYIRPGKKCTVVIPANSLKPLINFLETGNNPAHKWHTKGPWKATYRCEDFRVGEKDAANALEKLLDRSYVLTTSDEHQKLDSEIGQLASAAETGRNVDQPYLQFILSQAAGIVSIDWFREANKQSGKLRSFYDNYLALKKK